MPYCISHMHDVLLCSEHVRYSFVVTRQTSLLGNTVLCVRQCVQIPMGFALSHIAQRRSLTCCSSLKMVGRNCKTMTEMLFWSAVSSCQCSSGKLSSHKAFNGKTYVCTFFSCRTCTRCINNMVSGLSTYLTQPLMGWCREATSETSSSALITHAMLVAACGDAAKFFKPYQVWTCTGCQDTVPRFLPVRKPYNAHCIADRLR